MTRALPEPLLEARRAYRWTSALADILTGLRRRFEGDLDQYLLFMVFVQAETERALNGRPGPSVGLSALSVAAACGIPRETARGKLHRLTDAGWLQSGPDGLHYLSGKADGAGEYQTLNRITEPALRNQMTL